ncbi:hypothetical protein FB567DRAFT_102971 [Paraphoma chrysanthemicola]|uniref:C2H2-type domain-containing protein n=1 Tax=Paraphoma chrysanthemicola TaxID=798071 RepID=A0A8K0R009_9PLEO|nr:hypothetical protein FB567DRAFT_102971 [Paraphoma chrysanthemicola]
MTNPFHWSGDMDFFDDVTNDDYSAITLDQFLADPSETHDTLKNNFPAIPCDIYLDTSRSDHSAGHQQTTHAIDQNSRLAIQSHQRDGHAIATDVDRAGLTPGPSYLGSQNDVTAQQSTLMNEGSRHLNRPGVWLPTRDHSLDLIQSTSASAAQTASVDAASEYNRSMVNSAANISPTRSSPSQTSTIGHIQLCTETRGLVFRCVHPRCRVRPFRRPYEFERHYSNIHAAVKKEFWCPGPGCSRGNGKRPFTRKDRMMDHARKVHGIEIRKEE